MALYRDQGVILRTWKLGEADRIVTILTRDNGKVRAVAKGVRKTRSKFGARLEPGSHVQLQLYRTRGDLDIVTQVETIDRHPTLRDDLDRFGRASAMLEAVDQLAQEQEVNGRLYEMLARALATLADVDSPLVVAGFFWKVLSLEGFEPYLGSCVACGSDEPLVAFDLEAGGTLCAGCRRGRAITPEGIGLLRMILGGRLRDALAAPTTAATGEVDQLAADAMEHHLERRLRSLGVIRQG